MIKNSIILTITLLLTLYNCADVANISQHHRYLLACKAENIQYIPEFLSPLTQTTCDLACLYTKFEQAYKQIKPGKSPSTSYHQLGVRTALFSNFIHQYENNDEKSRNLRAFYANTNSQLSLSLTNYGYQPEADLVNLTSSSKCQICQASTSPPSTNACPANYQASNAKETTEIPDLNGMNNNQIINHFIDYTYFKCHSIPFCSTVYSYENNVFVGPALPVDQVSAEFAINAAQFGTLSPTDQNNYIEASLVKMINETFAYTINGHPSNGVFKFGDLSIRSRTVIMIVVVRLYYSDRQNLLTELRNGNLQYIYDKLEEFKLYEEKDVLGKNEKCGDSGEADIMFIVDGSGSVGVSSYWQGIDFIKNIVDQIQLGEKKIRIGAFEYSSGILENELSQLHYDKDFIKDKLAALSYINSGTNTAGAILHGINKLETGLNARPGVQKIMIVMTDGRSDLHAVQNAVVEMHKKDIQGFAIGIGSGFDYPQLKAIGADKNNPNIDPDVYTVSDYSKLLAIINSIIKSICTTPANLNFNSNSADPASQGQSEVLDLTATQQVEIALEKSGANFSIYSKILIDLQDQIIAEKFKQLAVRLDFDLDRPQAIEPPSVSLTSKNPNKYNYDFKASANQGGYLVDVPIIQSISISWDQNNKENIQVVFYIGINALQDNTNIKIQASVVKIQKPPPNLHVAENGLSLIQIFIIAGASIVAVVACLGFTTCFCMLRAKRKAAAKRRKNGNNEDDASKNDRSIMYRIQSMLGMKMNEEK